MKKNNFFLLPSAVVQELLGTAQETPAGGQTSTTIPATVAAEVTQAGDPGKEANMPDMGIGRKARDGAAYSPMFPALTRMVRLATVARDWLFNPERVVAATDTEGPAPTFVLTVIGEGTTRKGKPYTRLSGGGMLMEGANGLFARFGVRHHKGRSVNTREEATGFMPMAYLPEELTLQLAEAIEALDNPQGLQMQFHGGVLHVRCDKTGVPKRPFQGPQGVVWDHNLVGVETVRFVLPGQPGYLKTRTQRGEAMLASDWVYQDEEEAPGVQLSARERMKLATGIRTEADGVEAFLAKHTDVLWPETQADPQGEADFINPLEGV